MVQKMLQISLGCQLFNEARPSYRKVHTGYNARHKLKHISNSEQWITGL